MQLKYILTGLIVIALVVWYFIGKPIVNTSAPTEAELYRLENNLIVYYPSDAIKLLQLSLKSEGYGIKVDGIFGQATIDAAKDWQSKEMK